MFGEENTLKKKRKTVNYTVLPHIKTVWAVRIRLYSVEYENYGKLYEIDLDS